MHCVQIAQQGGQCYHNTTRSVVERAAESNDKPMSGDFCNYTFKIAFIGDVGVGKTALATRYGRGRFSERDVSTLGVDYITKILVIDNLRIKLEIWDTAGQERFRTITHSYYRNANGLVLAYDITKYESFAGLTHWIHDVKRYASPHALTCIVGTKKDLEEKREVAEEQARMFAAKYPVIDVIETSAKEDINVDAVFDKLIRALRNKYEGRFSHSIKVGEHSPGKLFSNFCSSRSCCE